MTIMRKRSGFGAALIGLLAGCASHPAVQSPTVVRLPWTSVEDMAQRIAMLPEATAPEASAALHVLHPEGLPDDVQVRLTAALASRGYEILHTLPDMVVETTNYEVWLALALPLKILNVGAWRLQPIAVQMWVHAIPYGVRPGNYVDVVFPQRLEARVREALDGVVPLDAWRTMQVQEEATADEREITWRL